MAPRLRFVAMVDPGHQSVLALRLARQGPSPKTAVVKTYPVPIAGFASLESAGHVFAANPAKERWQDAQLLERRREPTPRDGGRVVQGHVLYLGEISPSQ